MGVMRAALVELGDRPSLKQFQENICEGVDSVFLSLDSAMESDDRQSWDIATQLTGDRGQLMRTMRGRYLEAGSAITQARYGQHPADNQCSGRDILPVVEAGGGFQPVLRRGAVTAPAQAEQNPPAGALCAIQLPGPWCDAGRAPSAPSSGYVEQE